MKAVPAIPGIIVDIVPVVKNEKGHEQEQRHPPWPTVALAAATVDNCVAFARFVDDKAKLNAIFELVDVVIDVLDRTLIDRTLALDVLLVKAVVVNDENVEFVPRAVVVGLLSAKDNALDVEFVPKFVVVGLLSAKDNALDVELVFANVDVGVRFVDAAAAVAVVLLLDVRRKDRACRLDVEFEKLVAAATVAVPLPPL